MPATISDLLLQRIAKTGRMLAGCALCWPDEVLDATRDLPSDYFTDPRARRFIEALRADPYFVPDNGLDERALAIWLSDAMLTVPEGRELDIINLAMQLEQDWAAIKSTQRLQDEQRTRSEGVQR
jgi:hypothetical protein